MSRTQARVVDGHQQPDVAETVSRIWAEALKLDEVWPTAKFFDLGGNSLIATEIMYQVETALGIEFPVEIIFTDGTLASVIQACAQEREAGQRDQAAPPG